ncbi:hypothetical protein B296_00036491 [Ensete ventricosum]|uniref:Uncharacterized protein n=1 Tax=Ensete ventricosum TaxID=4639 RepID=A0A426XNL6_ENSVE|nr:hypothetical protein B296_00036491 [Ensete ventricosum]
MSFYSGCYRSFVPEIFTASMAYHTVVLLHVVMVLGVRHAFCLLQLWRVGLPHVRSFVPKIFTASIAYHVIVLLYAVRGPWGEVLIELGPVRVCKTANGSVKLANMYWREDPTIRLPIRSPKLFHLEIAHALYKGHSRTKGFRLDFSEAYVSWGHSLKNLRKPQKVKNCRMEVSALVEEDYQYSLHQLWSTWGLKLLSRVDQRSIEKRLRLLYLLQGRMIELRLL